MTHFLPGVTATASALNAQRTRLEVIGQNIANAQTTRGADGKPYQRQEVLFETVLRQQEQNQPAIPTLQVSRIQKDNRPYRFLFQPGHPDAGADGMVAMPNVNIHEEMADLIVASRVFEANLAVLKNARAMAMQTLAIGKR